MRLFLLVLATGFIVSVLLAGLAYPKAGASAFRYLWPPYPAFDFVDYTLRFPYLHTDAFFTHAGYPWYYPAPAIFVLYPFYKVAAATSRVAGFSAFALVALGCDLIVFLRFGRVLTRRGLRSRTTWALLGAVFLLTWPVYFALQRGNIESLIWVVIAAGIALLFEERYLSGALVLGLAGSFKLYPLLFLALLLRPKRFAEIGYGLALAAVLTLAALRFLEPNVGLAWRQVQAGIAHWTMDYTGFYDAIGLAPDHSLFSLIRQLAGHPLADPQGAVRFYVLLAGVTGTAVFLLRVLRLPRINQLIFLACASVSLPPVSYDYTLISLLVPCGALALVCLEDAKAGRGSAAVTACFVLFGIVLAALPTVYLRPGEPVYLQGVVRALALLALLVLSAWKPLPEGGSKPLLL